MIVVTTAGTFVIEATPSEDYLAVRSGDQASLEAMIDQLELVGTLENPNVLIYSADDIHEQEDTDNPHPFWLKVHRADAAIFLQSEVLNFLRYRKLRSHAGGLDELGTKIFQTVYNQA